MVLGGLVVGLCRWEGVAAGEEGFVVVAVVEGERCCLVDVVAVVAEAV